MLKFCTRITFYGKILTPLLSKGGEEINVCADEILSVQTDILKELRKEKALTQAAIGKYFNISGAMYSMYETNKRPMSIYMLCRLADLLETSTDYILGRTDDPRPPHPRKHYNIKEQKK